MFNSEQMFFSAMPDTENSPSMTDSFDHCLDNMGLGFEDDSDSLSSTPSSCMSPITPVPGSPPSSSSSPNTRSTHHQFLYPLPNLSQRSTQLHQTSYAPIYYQQMPNQQGTPKEYSQGSNLPFWTAAPLPFSSHSFPPTQIVPGNNSLTEGDQKRLLRPEPLMTLEKEQKRLHRQEAIKKWMNKRTRRNFNRKVAPQKSQAAFSRQRVSGKFVSTDEETRQMEIEIQRLKKQVEEEEFLAKSLEDKLNQTHKELSMLRSQGLVNGMLRSQAYLPTLEMPKGEINPLLDPRQGTIDYVKIRTKLKKTGKI